MLISYNNKFLNSNGFFVKKFYECYDIPYITRINNFIFTRDHEIEEKTYNNFINMYGSKKPLKNHENMIPV